MSTPQPKRSGNPPFEPVTLSEAKHQVKVAECQSHHDTELLRLIQAGRVEAERDVSIVAATSSFVVVYQDFPAGGFRLPFRNVTDVTEIKYTDGTGETVIDSADYRLITELVWPEVWPVGSWPTLSGNYPFPVTMTFTAGAATEADVDQGLKAMVLAYIDNVFSSNGETDMKTEGLGRVYEALNAGRHASYP